MTSTRERSATRRDALLAIGVISLEFAAAVSTMVGTTLLPVVAGDVAGTSDLGLLVTGAGLGLFVALPVAGPFAARAGRRAALTGGLLVHVAGVALAVTSTDAWAFAAGRFIAGFGGGLLAVFGISLVVERFEPALRARVVAASSAMWILPALVGPAVTVWLENVIGWRWTLAAPVPVVLAGRVLVALAGGSRTASRPGSAFSTRVLLVPVGVTALVLAARDAAAWPLAALGALVAVAGLPTLMPAGTITARRGVPAAMAVMVLFSTGYVGAGGLVTVLLTGVLETDLSGAAAAVAVAPLAWGTVSLVTDRADARRRSSPRPASRVRAGLGVAAAGTGVLVAVAVGGGPAPVAGAAWGAAGAGVGLAYPALYVACTERDDRAGSAVQLAAAVLAAEGFGAVLGPAIGGSLASVPGVGSAGLLAAYAVFAALLSAAAALSGRIVRPPDGPTRDRYRVAT